MKNNIIETITGFLVLLLAAFFCVKIYTTANKPMNNTQTIFALFNQVDGLTEGNEVRLNGVKIGFIDSIDLDKDEYQARVKMVVNKDYPLPKDTSAKIMSESFLGGKYVGIVPGNEEENLSNNDEITSTQSSVQLEDLLGRFIFNASSSK